MYKIMLVEDDFNLRNQVEAMLKLNEYEVYAVTEFRDIPKQVEAVKPDLIVLDINLPYLDGNYICRLIRKKYKMPIIITSANNGEADQILSMELGSDDYIIKPFNINVLISHINACIRRTYGEYTSQANNREIAVDGLRLDDRGMRLIYHNKNIELSKNEYILIKAFLSSVDKVLTREELLELIWDDKDFVDDNTLTVNVTRIKKKFHEIGYPGAIVTKRSVGYVLCTEIKNEENNM